MWLFVGILHAWAHPFGAQAVAHDLRVVVHADRVQALWGVDVPTPIILEDPGVSREQAFGRTMREVRGTVQVLAEGRAAGAGATSGEPYPSDATSWIFPVTVEAPRDTSREVEWVFSNGTFTDLRGFYRFSLQLDDSLEVIDSNLLLRGVHGEFAWDASDRWREGEGYREVTVTVGERTWVDRWWRRHIERRPETSGLLDGARLTSRQAWLTDPSVPWLPGLCVWSLGLLSSGRDERLSRTGEGRAVLLAGLLTALMVWFAPSGAGVRALVGGVGGGVLLSSRTPRSRRAGRVLFVAGLGAACGTVVGAAGALVWMAVGSAARPFGSRHLTNVAVVCGVLWLCLRWWAVR